jgi:transcription initiation factor TFIIIB Brf1 subunit/transcription initiation factor TFIIB
MLIEWDCPECGAINVDDDRETAVPMCGDCGVEVGWDEILVGYRETTEDAMSTRI